MIGKYFSLNSHVYDPFFGDEPTPAANISDVCPGGNEWILRHLGQCVSNNLQWASFVLGFISLVTWFLPSWPQIYQNYKRGSVEEALSPLFLCFWFSGDSMNLTGAILTKQLPVQIYVGVYYIFQDCIVLSQYVYYKAKNRWRSRLEKDLGPVVGTHSPVVVLLFGGLFAFPAASAFFSHSGLFSSNGNIGVETFKSRTLLAPMFNGATDEIGFACGSISAVCYLSGRIPQLIKNYKRQSTEGLSIIMYILICFGNATYGSSVILGCDGDPSTYFVRHLPWLVGSLACLFLDSIVFVQFFRYRNKKDYDTVPILNDSDQSSSNDPRV